ncbi:MAG: hypothetical protein FJW37_08320 [Acidobacteria bacterium]|nr:hypothetical protein [Acidobacteriota bacterium]
MKIALLACCFAALATAADPQLLGMAGAEPKLIAGVNVAQARVSPLAQFLLARMPQDDAALREFTLATGFDPRRDVTELLMVSNGQPGHPLMLARGAFDPRRIVEAAKSHGFTGETYKGVELLIHSRAHGGALAILDNSLAAFGSSDDVRAAIDRRSSPVSLAPQLFAKVNELSLTTDAWVITSAPLSELGRNVPSPAPQGPINGDILRKIERSSGGLKLGSNVEIRAEAEMPADRDATALADVLRFLAGMAQLNMPQNVPNPLQTLNIAAETNLVKVSISIPQAQLENLINSAPRRGQAARRRPANGKL